MDRTALETVLLRIIAAEPFPEDKLVPFLVDVVAGLFVDGKLDIVDGAYVTEVAK